MQQKQNNCDCLLLFIIFIGAILILMGIWQFLDIIYWLRDHVKIEG